MCGLLLFPVVAAFVLSGTLWVNWALQDAGCEQVFFHPGILWFTSRGLADTCGPWTTSWKPLP